ncbi:MAG: hypothetical protein LBJ11_10640 [Oscillospiraceae bacterium]|nr:hypothetical protein [Oscillospiraceae bacterium]
MDPAQFQFHFDTVRKGGYDPEQVSSYIETIGSNYQELYNAFVAEQARTANLEQAYRALSARQESLAQACGNYQELYNAFLAEQARAAHLEQAYCALSAHQEPPAQPRAQQNEPAPAVPKEDKEEEAKQPVSAEVYAIAEHLKRLQADVQKALQQLQYAERTSYEDVGRDQPGVYGEPDPQGSAQGVEPVFSNFNVEDIRAILAEIPPRPCATGE